MFIARVIPVALLLACAAPALPAASLFPDLVAEIDGPFQTTNANHEPILKFSTWAINMGAGEVELRGTTQNGTSTVRQWVYDAVPGTPNRGHIEIETGTFAVVGGRIRFNDSADYFLREVLAGDGVGNIVSANEKVAYCFVDTRKVTTRPEPPNTAPNAVYQTCGNILGTSVGWVDDYPSSFSSQFLALTGVSSGEYWLENILDPLNRIAELDDTNNLARVKVTVLNTGFASEINLLGNAQSIASGDATPASADHTDFAYVDVGSGIVTRTFTIQNLGDGQLSLLGVPKVVISGSGDFTVTAQPVSPVALSGGTTTFQVTFDPSVLGIRSATVVIANNDSNEASYQFAIVGNADADGDGLPDGWETLHNVTNSNADDDGDGYSNYNEYVAGTLPRDPTSRLAIKTTAISAEGYQISFQSLSGRIYRVDYTEGLGGSWEQLEQRVGDGTVITITDPEAVDEEQRFYRLKAGF